MAARHRSATKASIASARPRHPALLKAEMLHGVRHEHIVAIDAGPRPRSIENGAGGADERPAGDVLAVARLLADEQQACRNRTLTNTVWVASR